MTTSEGLGARESNSGGGEIFRIRTDRPWWLPNLLYNGYRVFPERKAAVAGLWPPPPLAPRLKKTETSSVYDCTVEDVELRYSHILFFCEEH